MFSDIKKSRMKDDLCIFWTAMAHKRIACAFPLRIITGALICSVCRLQVRHMFHDDYVGCSYFSSELTHRGQGNVMNTCVRPGELKLMVHIINGLKQTENQCWTGTLIDYDTWAGDSQTEAIFPLLCSISLLHFSLCPISSTLRFTFS